MIDNQFAKDAFVEECLRKWQDNELEPPLMDIIATHCGWFPLEVGEMMSVRVGSPARYEIRRIE